MSVASHFGIDLPDYDARIATFIPRYAEMIGEAATALRAGLPSVREVLDLGIGTGALAGAVVAACPRVRVTGIDRDAGMLRMAESRLGARLTATVGDVRRVPLPRADAVISSFALHHIRTRASKQRVYARARRALRPGGRLVLVDCFPADEASVWQHQRAVWLDHIATTFGGDGARRIMRTWAKEDTYLPLRTELAMLTAAGFAVEVAWRREAFAVLVGRPVQVPGRSGAGSR